MATETTLLLDPSVELASTAFAVRTVLETRNQSLYHLSPIESWSDLAKVHSRLASAMGDSGSPRRMSPGGSRAVLNESALALTALRLAAVESGLDQRGDYRETLFGLMSRITGGDVGRDLAEKMEALGGVLRSAAEYAGDGHRLSVADYYRDRPGAHIMELAMPETERLALEQAAWDFVDLPLDFEDSMLRENCSAEGFYSVVQRNYETTISQESTRPDADDAQVEMRTAVRIAFERQDAFKGPLTRLLESAVAQMATNRFTAEGDDNHAQRSLAVLADVVVRARDISRDRERVIPIARAQGIYFEELQRRGPAEHELER